MNRIIFASLLIFFALSFANCANISRNIENKSTISESEDDSRISHKNDKEIKTKVGSSRQTLSEDFQDIVDAFKGIYKFYDSFSIRDNDKPVGKSKPNANKVAKKKQQKAKKPKDKEKDKEGVTKIPDEPVTEKPVKPIKPSKSDKPKNEKKPKDDKKPVKKKNQDQKKKPAKTKQNESDVAPGLSMSQLFRREMKKLWTQLSKFVQENFYSAFEE